MKHGVACIVDVSLNATRWQNFCGVLQGHMFDFRSADEIRELGTKSEVNLSMMER
jgi:hypothetical protein